jgi:hypothetical protein
MRRLFADQLAAVTALVAVFMALLFAALRTAGH